VSTAIESGVAAIHVHNIREYSRLPHHEVDDSPYGGGPGMVTGSISLRPLLRCVCGARGASA
jgi:tRNA (guanine37-N1)-methyltransferase